MSCIEESSYKGFLSYKNIIEGEGTWYIEDDPPYNVQTGDVVIVPPNNFFY